jgi:hypothetical protein
VCGSGNASEGLSPGILIITLAVTSNVVDIGSRGSKRREVENLVKPSCGSPDERMKPLEPPDIYHLRSAVGWLELGKPIEANEELENITPQLRAHPDVLKVRWRVYAQAKKWEVCCEIGRTLTELEPDKPGGWIDHAQSLHRLGRTEEAYDLLPMRPQTSCRRSQRIPRVAATGTGHAKLRQMQSEIPGPRLETCL